MTDPTTAAPAASESTSAPAIPAEGPLTVRQATEARQYRLRQPEPTPGAAPDTKQPQPRVNGRFAKADEADQSSTEEVQDAAPIEASGETESADPVEIPSIDPPKSWTKEDKEWFAELPPDKQARIAERERSRDQDFSRRQNEATQARQAAEAERQAALKLRQQYEQTLPNLLQTLQSQTAGEFADIKTHDDVVKMATDDPFRYARWDAQQKQIARVRDEVAATQRQQEQDQKTQFEAWSAEQDKKFTEQAKDFADPVKAPKLREGIVNYLTEVRGVEKEALPGLWSNPLFRDARTQAIFYDAYRWNEAQKAAKAAATKPTPAPMRPGTAPDKGASAAATIKQLEAKLANANTTHLKIQAATELRLAKQQATRR